jgi:RimJ/RimL family protein N-acetyltransferase
MLQGKKTALAAIRSSDYDLLYKWINDPDLMRWLTPYRPVDPGSFSNWFNNIGRDGSIIFGIRCFPDDRLIGTILFTAINNINRSAEVAIKIGSSEDRGQGYGHEALSLAVQFAWDDLNLNRLALTVYHDNEPAIQAYRAAGFEQEGRLRRAVHVKGAWKDLLIMSILRPDFG